MGVILYAVVLFFEGSAATDYRRRLSVVMLKYRHESGIELFYQIGLVRRILSVSDMIPLLLDKPAVRFIFSEVGP